MATINISIPQAMYEDLKKLMKKNRYASISEVVREGLRKVMYPEITENGFTKEFEDEVLRAAAEPDTNIIMETDEDIDKYFEMLLQELEIKKHAQS